MRKMILGAALLFVGCGRPPSFSTPSMVDFYDIDPMLCEEVSAHETRLRDHAKDFNFDWGRVEGWSVYIRPTGWTEDKVDVWGTTRCEMRTSWVNIGTWKSSTYHHELLHALTNCFDSGDKKDPYHADWGAKGYWQLLKESMVHEQDK